MKRKSFFVIPVVFLLAVVPLLVGGLTISTAASEDAPHENPRVVDPSSGSRPAPLRPQPEWGGAWQYGPDTSFQFTRFDGEFFPTDGKVYFMGGRLASGDTDGSVWSYDPSTLVYTDMGVDLITPISNYTMNLLQDASGDWGFYVFCGRPAPGGVTPVVQVYYPETNTVVQLDSEDNFPGSFSCTSAVNVVYNNMVYLAGGFDGSVNSAETWVFDPTQPPGSKWTHIPSANLSSPRAYIMGGLVDDLIYAIGGNYFDGAALISVETVEVLDPNAPEPVWDDAAVSDLPEICSEGRAYSFDTGSPFADLDGTPLGGKIISSCGDWPDENERVYVYDTYLDTWEEFPFLQTDRRDHAAAFIPTNHPVGTGMPGLWVWGGRKDADTNVLTSSEYYKVNYTGFDCDVLVVADDWKFGSVWGGTPYYTSALDYLEFEYDVWETGNLIYPEFADMIAYDAVIWFTGYAWQDVFLTQNEAEVGAYLDAGGNFLLSSLDYHYEAGLTDFMQNYLGVESVVDDVIELDPAGVDSNPIGHGLGPYTMARPDDWEIYWPEAEYEGPYDDYAYAKPGAAEPFLFDTSGEPNSTNYDSGTFRSVFLAWPFEWIDTVEERAEIMDAALGWMCSAGLGNVNLIPPIQSDSGIPGETVPYTLTLINNMGFAETFTITYESDWPLSGPSSIGPIPNGSSESFEVEMLVPLEANCYETGDGVVTATAMSDPELSAAAYLTTSALPDGIGDLAGTVYDLNTGLGIPQAYVFFELDEFYYETWTDESGEYGMTELPACTYMGGFNAMGYENQFDVPFEINNGSTTTLDAHLAAALPELSTESISVIVPLGSIDEYSLAISNAGSGDLHFYISDIPPESIYPTPDMQPMLPSGVDARLYAELNAHPGATTKFIVYFKEQADLTPAFYIKDRDARGQYVLDALRAVANSSQAGLTAELDRQGVEYESRYIVNAMVVTGDLQLLNQISAQNEVAYIGANLQIPAPQPLEMTPADGGISAVAWNIAQVNADDVWSEFGVTGAGIVVSNIDTGVQYDHPALVNQYRGNLGAGSFDHNFNWWDPYGDQPMAPYDYHSHGSHTIGTMVGDDGTEQIGMAPDGQWIACNGFKQGGYGYTVELLECAEFILAPWDLAGENPNPDLRPDVVNNSWGGGQADWWYNQAIYAWRAAGIFPVFSNGNAGPNCSTTGAPDYANVMTVGATNNMDVIAGFSSRGPALITEITKPDVAAPGVSVFSAYNNGGYGTMSGTSMSAPHVAGQAALIWSAVPELRGDVELTYWIIEQTAMPILDGQCGDPNPPNNVYGWGRIDAFDAVSLALDNLWETPWLTVDPLMGVVAPDEEAEILLSFDTHDLEDGECYASTLRIEFNDPYVLETFLPVELCVMDVADLQVDKTAEPSPVIVGDPLTYTITVENLGPSLATGVLLADTLPDGVGFVSASDGCNYEDGVVTCDLGELAAGASASVSVQVTAPEIPGEITNEALVTSGVFDNDLTNNVFSLLTVVEEPPIRHIYLPMVISQ